MYCDPDARRFERFDLIECGRGTACDCGWEEKMVVSGVCGGFFITWWVDEEGVGDGDGGSGSGSGKGRM